MSKSEIIFSVQESPQGGYEARALAFSITQADSLEELETTIRDALSCHFGDEQLPITSYPSHCGF